MWVALMSLYLSRGLTAYLLSRPGDAKGKRAASSLSRNG